MDLTELRFHERIVDCRGCIIPVGILLLLYWLQQMGDGKEKGQSQLVPGRQDCIRKIKGIKGVHMQNVKEKVSFYLTAAIYLLFNLRPAPSLSTTLQATLWQILQTAPYVAGITWFLIAVLQYMADGEKVPWERRFRLFFTIGIFAGLVYAIIEYTGKGTVQ